MKITSKLLACCFLLLSIQQATHACIGEWGHPASLAPGSKGGKEVNNQMNESQFFAIIAKMENLYNPDIIARGSTLKINKLWSNDTANASAIRKGPVYEVNMYGGLARHKNMTADGFAMVLCHELGHHLAGKPRVKPNGLFASLFGIEELWASNEGQSDYFASTKCMRRYLADEDNIAYMQTATIPEIVKSSCRNSFKDHQERAICERISMAGQALANTLHSLRNPNNGENTKFPSFEKPSTNKVRTTFNSHPQAQCRLDTYFQGALCKVSKDVQFSIENESQGACIKEKSGTRPACWFKISAK
jgi:hypothetical protein